MKPKVYVTRAIPEAGMAMLRDVVEIDSPPPERMPNREELLKGVRGVQGIVSLLTETIDEEALDAAGVDLRIVSNMAVGFNNVDLAAATRRGILVTNTPGVLTETTADLAFALLLAAARRVVEGDKFTRQGKFDGWGPLLMMGQDVHERTLGVVGFGRIGQAVAERAAGFRMRVLYFDPHIEGDPTGLGSERWKRVSTLDALLEQSDFVTLHPLLTAETTHLIGKRQLEKMKPSAYLINTSRGPVVDEEALVEALEKRIIAGAALDVFEEEPRVHPGLLVLDNCVIVPHIASASVETRSRMATMAAENLLAGLAGKRPPNLVNPEALEARSLTRSRSS